MGNTMRKSTIASLAIVGFTNLSAEKRPIKERR